MTRLHSDMIHFDFVGYGDSAADHAGGTNRLYLDVGNRLAAGAIDHHQLAAYSGSTASLVLTHGDLVLASLAEPANDRASLTIVLHEHPDLDCIASSYLAMELLTSGAFPSGSPSLARYVDRVDQGYLGMSLEKPFSLYSACMILGNRLAQRVWTDPKDLWRTLTQDALRVVGYVVQEAGRLEKSILDIDAFSCPGLFGRADRREVTDDIERYRQKLAAPEVHARQLSLSLPCEFGGKSDVDALLVREVQSPSDENRVLFFKDWARSDKERSARHDGFVALSIFQQEPKTGRARCILSVKPESDVDLRGLGSLLDQAESAERIRRFGIDDRVENPITHEKPVPRPGYLNADPWYDGRAHGYTIVDSPRSGTLLTADAIDEIFIAFGHRTASSAAPLELPAREAVSISLEPDEAMMQRMTSTVARWHRHNGKTEHFSVPDIFISYSRASFDWVNEHVYAPLRQQFGDDRVFFDTTSLAGGVGWLARLATAVSGCRIFLPVYCEDYFRSDFCHWELQLAVVRDPTGTRGIILPLSLDSTPLPDYCKLIQTHDATHDDFRRDLFEIIRRRLN